MDDLISRKRLLEHISAWQQANAGAETQTEYAVIESCYRMAQNFPTGYDVEAVVRELEEKIEHHWERSNYCYDNELYIANSEHLGKCEAFREAIKIVKRGGRE